MWLLVSLLGFLFANVVVTTDHHNTSSNTLANDNETMADRVTTNTSNLTKLSNETLKETNHSDTFNDTEVQNGTETTDNNIFGNLTALKRLISKTYWEQRLQDPYYLSEALIPFCAGILVSWLLILVFCTLKCCCVKKNKRNKLLKIRTIKNDPQKDGSQWMLLEKNSSDEEI